MEWCYFAHNIVVLFPAALAMGLCVAMIAFVRLPSLKVSCLLLSGLLIYDVFWVSKLMQQVILVPRDGVKSLNHAMTNSQ